MTDSTVAGRLMAFIETGDFAQRGTLEGMILYWEPPFNDEVAESHHLEDHIWEKTTSLRGLVMFEGYVHVTSGPDPDVEFHGEWRRLTHWEMLQVQSGSPPWSRP